MDKQQWQERGKGHRQRLRDKFLDKGIDAFSDSEIIELLLSFGTPRSDCKPAAKNALATFGSLPAVLDASFEELQQVNGIGPKNIFALHFIQAVARRYLKLRVNGKQYITSSREVSRYLIHSMRDLKREILKVVFLDASHAVIDTKTMATGTITVNTVYPRELIKTALQMNAAALVLAHNHPSGNIRPSSQDKELTKAICLACTYMHIQVLDHLIIGEGEEVFSFADNGLMGQIRHHCSQLLATPF